VAATADQTNHTRCYVVSAQYLWQSEDCSSVTARQKVLCGAPVERSTGWDGVRYKCVVPVPNREFTLELAVLSVAHTDIHHSPRRGEAGCEQAVRFNGGFRCRSDVGIDYRESECVGQGTVCVSGSCGVVRLCGCAVVWLCSCAVVQLASVRTRQVTVQIV
jgi:hypothetical protein